MNKYIMRRLFYLAICLISTTVYAINIDQAIKQQLNHNSIRQDKFENPKIDAPNTKKPLTFRKKKEVVVVKYIEAPKTKKPLTFLQKIGLIIIVMITTFLAIKIHKAYVLYKEAKRIGQLIDEHNKKVKNINSSSNFFDQVRKEIMYMAKNGSIEDINQKGKKLHESYNKITTKIDDDTTVFALACIMKLTNEFFTYT